jgi:nucleoside-diphosphate-sugar epimerase
VTRLLFLGGTGFIGPHFVEAAVARGHAVTVFNRGRSGAELPDGVERVVGDRNGDLAPIAGRDWPRATSRRSGARSCSDRPRSAPSPES